jgi:hypothetical protein
MPNNRRIFTATLVLGVPGAGKTSLLATFARYLWETHRKVLLLYSWDGGAIPTDLQKLMRQGLIRFWRARTRSAEGLGIETLYLATKGYWPREIDPETGETSPGVDLVPPVTTLYTIACRKTGEILATLPTRGVITPTYCGGCKTLHPQSELNIAETVKRTPGFEMVGGVAYDGLTSMTNEVLSFMDHARGAGQVGGEKSAFGGVVVSGSIKLGGTNRADIGLGQSRGREFVNNSLSIPNLVEGPVFTALAMEATDEGGLPIVGAKLPGRAATDEASSWFGNVFEMGKTPDEQGKEHFTLFLQPFTDAQNRRHLLKTSSSPMGLPPMLVDPLGQPWAQANLGKVFALLDLDLQHALAEDIPGAPGLALTPTSYGERFSVTPAAAAPPAAPTTLPALSVPTPPAAAAAPTPPTPAAATQVVTARRRPQRIEAPAEPVAGPGVEPQAELAAVAASINAGAGLPASVAAPGVTGPPPPPGMKPPARLQTS